MTSILFAILLFFVASSVVEAKMIRGGIETTLIENNDGRSVISYDSRTRIGLRLRLHHHSRRRLEDEEQDQEQDTDVVNFNSMSKAAKIWTILFCLWMVFWIGAICFSCCDYNSSTTRSESTTRSNNTNNDSKSNSLLIQSSTNDDKGESRNNSESRRKGKRESKGRGRGKRGRPKLRMFGRNMIEFKAFRQNSFVVIDGNHFHRGGNKNNITKQQQHQHQQQQQYIRD